MGCPGQSKAGETLSGGYANSGSNFQQTQVKGKSIKQQQQHDFQVSWWEALWQKEWFPAFHSERNNLECKVVKWKEGSAHLHLMSVGTFSRKSCGSLSYLTALEPLYLQFRGKKENRVKQRESVGTWRGWRDELQGGRRTHSSWNSGLWLHSLPTDAAFISVAQLALLFLELFFLTFLTSK